MKIDWSKVKEGYSLMQTLEKENKQLKTQLQQKENIIKEVRQYIVKHCVNEKVSKEVGFNCYTMADTNELEYIMKKLGDDDE